MALGKKLNFQPLPTRHKDIIAVLIIGQAGAGFEGESRKSFATGPHEKVRKIPGAGQCRNFIFRVWTEVAGLYSFRVIGFTTAIEETGFLYFLFRSGDKKQAGPEGFKGFYRWGIIYVSEAFGANGFGSIIW